MKPPVPSQPDADPEGVAEKRRPKALAHLQGADSSPTLTGGCAGAATPGYLLVSLRDALEFGDIGPTLSRREIRK